MILFFFRRGRGHHRPLPSSRSAASLLGLAACASWLVWLAGCRPPAAVVAAAGTPAGSQAAPTSTASAPAFVDVTRRAGIDFTATNGKTANKYMLETLGSGCAFIDYDNDGRLDILLLNGRPLDGRPAASAPTLKLYHNNGDGTFTDVTARAGLNQTMYAFGCAVGDYDNDGYDDIYVTCALGPSRLYHNNHNGTFTDRAVQAGVTGQGLWGTSCAWADVDNDGRLDLIVCNYVRYRTLRDDVPCYESNGKRTYCIPTDYLSSHPVLYHNNGDGTFTDITKQAGMDLEGKCLGVAIGDYDGDGLPDIFIANDGTQGFVFHNLGHNRFEEIGVKSGIAYDDRGIPHSGMGIDLDDVDNNGRCSLVLTNYAGQQTSLYRQVAGDLWHDDKLTDGVGPPTMNMVGFGACFCDYDNDGRKDLMIVNGHVQDTISESRPDIHYAEPPLLFHNEGAGRFREVGQAAGGVFSAPIVGRGLARGDYDNDGREDLLITTNGGPAYLWRNETPTANHWLEIKLIGVKSNRDGIGAWITAKTDAGTLRTYVRSGSSYLSSSDLRAHFGLGGATRADIEVKWPSGVIDRIPAVPADRNGKLTEGSGRLQ